MKDNEIEITIWDNDGNIVVHETQECQTATEDEIKKMVALIEAGMPAHLAASLIVGKSS